MSAVDRLAGKLAKGIHSSRNAGLKRASFRLIPDSDKNMSRPAVAIPEKLFFKIGEVCDLAGVQAHVLRGGSKLKIVGSEDDANQPPLPVEFSAEEEFLPAATFTREPIAPRTAEERQGLKKLAAERRELLSLLDKENQNRAN